MDMTQRRRNPLDGRRRTPPPPDIPDLGPVSDDGLTAITRAAFPEETRIVNTTTGDVSTIIRSGGDESAVILNGDFEVSTAGWQGYNCTIERATSSPTPHSGSGCLKMTSLVNGVFECATPQGTDAYPVNPGEVYSIGYSAIQQTGNSSFFLYPYFYDADGNFISTGDESFNVLVGKSSGWLTKPAEAWKVPANGAYMSLDIVVNQAVIGNWYAVDDIVVQRRDYLDVGVATANRFHTSDEPIRRIEVLSDPAIRFWGVTQYEAAAAAIYPTLDGTDGPAAQYGLLLQSPGAGGNRGEIELRSQSHDGTSYPAAIYFNGRPYHFYHKADSGFVVASSKTIPWNVSYQTMYSSAVTITKFYPSSTLYVQLNMSGYQDAVATAGATDFGVYHATPGWVQCIRTYWNSGTAGNHRFMSGGAKITGLAAGTYTFEIGMYSGVNAFQNFKQDSGDFYQLCIEESWDS